MNKVLDNLHTRTVLRHFDNIDFDYTKTLYKKKYIISY